VRRVARTGRWLVGAAVALGALGLTAAASRAEPFQAGAKELALVAGYSLSHNELVGNVDTLNAYHVLPHVGYFLTDESGRGWLRGNLELVTEPTLLVIEGQETTTLAGVTVLSRWVFAGTGRVRPYFEAGGGVLAGSLRLRETRCHVTFALQGGIGALVFVSERTAITAGYRFHHLSNGNTCDGNPGLDSSMFVLGVSRFFP